MTSMKEVTPQLSGLSPCADTGNTTSGLHEKSLAMSVALPPRKEIPTPSGAPVSSIRRTIGAKSRFVTSPTSQAPVPNPCGVICKVPVEFHCVSPCVWSSSEESPVCAVTLNPEPGEYESSPWSSSEDAPVRVVSLALAAALREAKSRAAARLAQCATPTPDSKALVTTLPIPFSLAALATKAQFSYPPSTDGFSTNATTPNVGSNSSRNACATD
mmetsp:Transcript_1506/g.5138  ORF Transcript_1506/g.5138 Transcript_1506/m.5138 type:complete len:215 (-) Transcript_1506:2549-3193(-)